METAPSTTGRPVAAAAQARPKAAGRLLYIDNIRVFLTILVLLHHLMITYSGTGDWYYNEGSPDFIATALGGWFCATNQAYFMGLFLLISAYFVPGSYDRKGAGKFLKARLIRLGIPLAVYSWIINPDLRLLPLSRGDRHLLLALLPSRILQERTHHWSRTVVVRRGLAHFLALVHLVAPHPGPAQAHQLQRPPFRAPSRSPSSPSSSGSWALSYG